MTRTDQTQKEIGDVREAMTLKIVIEVKSQLDSGEWRSTTFGNEPAAIEFETKMNKRGVATRRESL